MELYLYNYSLGNRKLIGSSLTYERAIKIINKYIETNIIKSYYRIVHKNIYGEYIIDFGSHEKCFIISGSCPELDVFNERNNF